MHRYVKVNLLFHTVRTRHSSRGFASQSQKNLAMHFLSGRAMCQDWFCCRAIEVETKNIFQISYNTWYIPYLTYHQYDTTCIQKMIYDSITLYHMGQMMVQHLGFFEEYRLPVWTFLWCSLPSNVMVFRQCSLNQVSGHNKPMSAAHHHTQHHTHAQHDSWSPPASCKWFVRSKPLRWARSRVSLSKWVLPKLNAGIDMLWFIGDLLEGPRPGWNKNAYESILSCTLQTIKFKQELMPHRWLVSLQK